MPGLKLDADAISALPAHTAPYPANSDPETVGTLKKRLLPEDGGVWPMVMSVGYNPYFKNEKVTAVRPGMSCEDFADIGRRSI